MHTNIEAEQHLLGSLLLNNLGLYRCADLAPEDFAEPLHGRIFAAIREVARDSTANPLTLKTLFESDPALVDIGGAAYLVKLVGLAGLVLDLEHLVSEILRLSKRRQIVMQCRSAIAALDNPDSNEEETATLVCSFMQGITSQSRRLRAMGDSKVTLAVADDLESGSPCYSTGIEKLDKAMGGGIFQGKAYGFAALKKVGKTVMVATLSANLAEQGIKHAVICGEMGAKEVHQRVMARRMEVNCGAFIGDYGRTEAFRERLRESMVWYTDSALYHHTPGLTFDELKDMVAADVRIHGIKGYILDYWQLVGGARKGQSEREHLDQVAQWIADSCRRFGVFAIVTGQINKDGTTRGGEGMRLAFDQVYQLHRENVNQPDLWLEMMDTRYTPWFNIGSENVPGLIMRHEGPHFVQA